MALYLRPHYKDPMIQRCQSYTKQQNEIQIVEAYFLNEKYQKRENNESTNVAGHVYFKATLLHGIIHLEAGSQGKKPPRKTVLTSSLHSGR